jgi:hypothetical protein
MRVANAVWKSEIVPEKYGRNKAPFAEFVVDVRRGLARCTARGAARAAVQ